MDFVVSNILKRRIVQNISGEIIDQYVVKCLCTIEFRPLTVKFTSFFYDKYAHDKYLII